MSGRWVEFGDPIFLVIFLGWIFWNIDLEWVMKKTSQSEAIALQLGAGEWRWGVWGERSYPFLALPAHNKPVTLNRKQGWWW